MPDFAVPPNDLADIAYECGVISSLYYASTEVYHVGREDVGLGAEKQAARSAMSNVASQLIGNAIQKRLVTLHYRLKQYFEADVQTHLLTDKRPLQLMQSEDLD